LIKLQNGLYLIVAASLAGTQKEPEMNKIHLNAESQTYGKPSSQNKFSREAISRFGDRETNMAVPGNTALSVASHIMAACRAGEYSRLPSTATTGLLTMAQALVDVGEQIESMQAEIFLHRKRVRRKWWQVWK